MYKITKDLVEPTIYWLRFLEGEFDLTYADRLDIRNLIYELENLELQPMTTVAHCEFCNNSFPVSI